MTTQRSFLDPPALLPHQLLPSERAPQAARFGGQKLRIIQRLRSGTATGRELCAIGLNYRARVSELRQSGFVIAVVENDENSGRTLYRLVSEPA